MYNKFLVYCCWIRTITGVVLVFNRACTRLPYLGDFSSDCSALVQSLAVRSWGLINFTRILILDRRSVWAVYILSIV